MEEIGGKWYFMKVELQIDSTESKIVQFGFDFAEKSRFEVDEKFSDIKIVILAEIHQN